MTQLVKIFKTYRSLWLFLYLQMELLAYIFEEWSACILSLFKMSLRGFGRLKGITEG